MQDQIKALQKDMQAVQRYQDELTKQMFYLEQDDKKHHKAVLDAIENLSNKIAPIISIYEDTVRAGRFAGWVSKNFLKVATAIGVIAGAFIALRELLNRK